MFCIVRHYDICYSTTSVRRIIASVNFSIKTPCVIPKTIIIISCKIKGVFLSLASYSCFNM